MRSGDWCIMSSEILILFVSVFYYVYLIHLQYMRLLSVVKTIYKNNSCNNY